MSGSTEVLSNVLYRAQSHDFQRGYDRGWDDAYLEMGMEDWAATPPFFRRFYWHDKEGFDVTLLKLHLFDRGEDEYCNPVLNLRLWNGVLSIRYGRKVRSPQDGVCDQCRKDEEEYRNAH